MSLYRVKPQSLRPTIYNEDCEPVGCLQEGTIFLLLEVDNNWCSVLVEEKKYTMYYCLIALDCEQVNS